MAQQRVVALGIIGLLILFGGALISILVLLAARTWYDGLKPSQKAFGDWSGPSVTTSLFWPAGLAADEVPGSLPRKSPPQATGRNNNKRNKILTILHWNAEGISRKKLALANQLKKEDIDVACIQESHLIPHPKHGRRFTMKGYHTFKHDRQDGPKGGVITLVKNNITAWEIKVNTGDRAEMIRTELHFKFKDKNITIYNCYCPPGKEQALHAMNISDQCIVVGDF
ncbi:AP-like endonuclease/reverse transcriptase [Elysia marginata]|uniref:AP-like endonuclease/reverse transcriptase n=1 Tax=Elysia marginata TaxID=1093978 RepID=A0AAV4JSD8_9GAST|nr:AP-like endonuclease/reverse transcriptase [Elysia marginata]